MSESYISKASLEHFKHKTKIEPEGEGSWLFSTEHPTAWDYSKHKEKTISVVGELHHSGKKAYNHFNKLGHTTDQVHLLS